MRWPYRDKRIEWDEEKNETLLRKRGVSFNDVVLLIEEERVIDVIPHWDETRRPHQQAIIIMLNDYIHVVPFVVDEEKVFLKTIFASRKITQRYMR